LLFLTRPDNLDKYTKKIGFLPPDRGVLQVWAQDSLYRVLVEQAENGRAYPNIPDWGNIESVLVEMFSAIWTLLDTRGVYTDEELFKILTQYNGKLNQIMKVPDNTAPATSLIQFQESIKSMKTLADLETEDSLRIAKATAPAVQPKSSGSLVVYGGIAAGVLLLLAIALLIIRKKKHA